MTDLLNDVLEITFNEKTELFSLWLNGKIIKTSKSEKVLENHAEMLVELGKVS